jgi:hypothetical protein
MPRPCTSAELLYFPTSYDDESLACCLPNTILKEETHELLKEETHKQGRGRKNRRGERKCWVFVESYPWDSVGYW